MSLQELIEFEKRAENVADKLVFWGLPIRAALSAMYTLIDQFIHGSLDGKTPPRVEDGEAVAYRLSHLVPRLARCPADPSLSAQEAVEQFTKADPTGENARQLLTYAHFCELMPEARKGHYEITRRPGGFDLTHPSQAFKEAEVKDILLSELALGFEAKPPPRVDFRCGILSGRIGVQEPWRSQYFLSLHVDVMQELYEHAYHQLVEPLILTEAGFHAAVGAGREEFLRFRAAMVAIARFCQQMCSWYRAPIQGGDRTNHVAYEYGEWVSVCWRDNYFFENVRQMAGLTPEQAKRLLSIYSIDLRAGKPEVVHARDGYFPPVWRLPGFVLFSPEVLVEAPTTPFPNGSGCE